MSDDAADISNRSVRNWISIEVLLSLLISVSAATGTFFTLKALAEGNAEDIAELKVKVNQIDSEAAEELKMINRDVSANSERLKGLEVAVDGIAKNQERALGLLDQIAREGSR